MIGSYCKVKDESNAILVEIPFEIEEDKSFVIEYPYTDRFYFGMRESKKNLGFERPALFRFPPMKLLDNRRRLVKVLWLPNRKKLFERILQSQAEFYNCALGSEMSCLAIPLRVQKDIKFEDTPAWRHVHFEYPTFVFDYHLLGQLNSMFFDNQSTNYIESEFMFHKFTFWKPDEQGLKRPLNCIQFIFE